MSLRLFSAVTPPPEVLQHLDAALTAVGGGSGAGVGGGPPDLRWTDPATWHITLAFHGQVPTGTAELLCRELRHSLPTVLGRGGESRAHLAGAGVFSGRTLWIGVQDDGALPRLSRACLEAAEAVGLEVPPDAPPRLRAHLTIARLSSRGPHTQERRRRQHERRRRRGPGSPELDPALALPLNPLEQAARALAVYRGPDFPVASVEVYASHLGEGRGGGPRHELLESIDLQGRSAQER